MSRWLALVAALACACKGKDLGPVHDGISRIDVRPARRDEPNEHYLVVTFTARMPAPMEGSYGMSLRAACQVGVDRLLDEGQTDGKLEAGVAVDVVDNPFYAHPLPAEPSLCDLTFLEKGRADPREIGRACWDGKGVADGPCPPNNISHVGVGPTGLTGVLSNVGAFDAQNGWPAQLTLRYRVTAHRDMPRGSYLVRMTSCPGYRNDDVWHSELGGLRAGESLFAAENTLKLGRPKAGTPCETVLGYAPEVNGEITELATFCHKDSSITPGECPR